MQKSKSLPNLQKHANKIGPRKNLSAQCFPALNIEQALFAEMQMESITHTSAVQAGACAIQTNEPPFDVLNRAEDIKLMGLNENDKDLLSCLLECSNTDLFSEIVVDDEQILEDENLPLLTRAQRVCRKQKENETAPA